MLSPAPPPLPFFTRCGARKRHICQSLTSRSSAFASVRPAARTCGGCSRWSPSSSSASFIVYATWALLQGEHYHYGHYLSPFYSPELFGNSPHACSVPGAGPGCPFVPFSPALLILGFPLAFRFTCYYYRGAYYKAFWADPVACAVGEPRNELPRRGQGCR